MHTPASSSGIGVGVTWTAFSDQYFEGGFEDPFLENSSSDSSQSGEGEGDGEVPARSDSVEEPGGDTLLDASPSSVRYVYVCWYVFPALSYYC